MNKRTVDLEGERGRLDVREDMSSSKMEKHTCEREIESQKKSLAFNKRLPKACMGAIIPSVRQG